MVACRSPKPLVRVQVLPLLYGIVAKWSNAVDCKSIIHLFESGLCLQYAPIDKWFKSPALQAGVTGSNPVGSIKIYKKDKDIKNVKCLFN